MKIVAQNFNGKDIRISFEAESCAEFYQIDALKKAMATHGADWYEFNDGEGSRGIGVVANVKVSGPEAALSPEGRARLPGSAD